MPHALGKTLQTISVLSYLKHERGMKGASLVVCPLSVLSSWMNEFKKWAPRLVTGSILKFYPVVRLPITPITSCCS